MSTIAEQLVSKSKKQNNPKTEKLVHDSQARMKNKQTEHNNNRHRQPVYLEDGLDHVNIWGRGETALGRALSMETDIDLTVHGMGKFRSVFALWAFLTTKERTDALRDAPAFALRNWLKTREETDNVINYPNVRFICAYSIAEYIVNDPGIKASLIETGNAPIISYIVNRDGTKITHPHAEWWVYTLTLIRRCLIQGIEITTGTFEELLDTDETDEDIFTLPEVKAPRRLGEIKQPEQPVKQKQPVLDKATGQNFSSREEMYRQALKPGISETYLTIRFDKSEERKAYMVMLTQLNKEGFITWLETELVPHNLGQGPYQLVITYNYETNEFVGLGTTIFENPYEPYDNRKVVVQPDEDVREKIIDVLGASTYLTLEDLNPIPVEHYKKKDKKAKKEEPEVQVEDKSEDVSGEKPLGHRPDDWSYFKAPEAVVNPEAAVTDDDRERLRAFSKPGGIPQELFPSHYYPQALIAAIEKIHGNQEGDKPEARLEASDSDPTAPITNE